MLCNCYEEVYSEVKNIIEITAIFIESLIISIFLCSYFKEKKSLFPHSNKVFLTAIIFTLELISYIFMEDNVAFQILISLMIFIYSIYFFYGKANEKIVVSLLVFVIAILINYPVITLTSYVTGLSFDEICSDSGYIRIQVLLITKVMYAASAYIIIKIKEDNGYNLNKSEFILFVFTIASIILFSSSFDYVMFHPKYSKLIYFVMTLFITFSGVVILLLIEDINRKNSEKINNKVLEAQIEAQKKDIERMMLNYEQLSEMKHDLKNYFLVVSELIKNNNNEEAVRYMNDICKNKIDSSGIYVKTESDILNALLNSEIQKAKNNNINIQVQITSKISDDKIIDLTNVIANLLDNAIEYCVKRNSSCNNVYLYISKISNCLNITVENDIDESVLKSNPKLLTNKSDKENHGIGLRSVNSTIKKYGGTIDLFEENKKMIANILIPD